MDDRAPPIRSITAPRSSPPRPENDNRQPQPYRPSLLRQPDDPGVDAEAERAGTTLALATLAAVLVIAGITAWAWVALR